jgi:hypothetical protein
MLEERLKDLLIVDLEKKTLFFPRSGRGGIGGGIDERDEVQKRWDAFIGVNNTIKTSKLNFSSPATTSSPASAHQVYFLSPSSSSSSHSVPVSALPYRSSLALQLASVIVLSASSSPANSRMNISPFSTFSVPSTPTVNFLILSAFFRYHALLFFPFVVLFFFFFFFLLYIN